MATRKRIEVEARFTAKDQASGTITRVEGRFKRLTNTIRSSALAQVAALGGVVVALRALVRGISSAIQKSKEQEVAINQLDGALVKLGDSAAGVSQRLQEQAAELQKVSTFGDETIIKAQALIAAFVSEEDQIKQATKATLDLAAAKGFDLVTAADLVSKTLGSSTNALTRYGIEVVGAVGSTARLESLTNSISNVFGGRAKKDTETFEGAMKQLSNAFGDGLEKIGDFITGSKGLLNAIRETTTFIQENESAIRQFADGVGNFFGFIGSRIQRGAGQISGATKLIVQGVQFFSSAAEEGQASTAALEATAARLGITVAQLRVQLDAEGGSIGKVKVAADGAADATDRLAAAQAALETQQRQTTQAIDDSLAVIRSLGVTLQSDAAEKVARLRETISGLGLALDEGRITAEDYQRGVERLNQEIEAINKGFKDFNDLMSNTTPVVDEATRALDTNSDALNRNEVQLRHVTRAHGAFAQSANSAGAAAANLAAVSGGTISGPSSSFSGGGLSPFGQGGGRFNFAGGGSTLIRKDGRGGTITPAEAVALARTATVTPDGKVA